MAIKRLFSVPGLATVAFLLVATGNPAVAQVSALRQHNSDAPIDIDAQRIEVRDKDRLVLFDGGVKVRQEGLAMDAQRIRMRYTRTEGSNPTVLRIDAEGGVQLRSSSETASAQWGIYDVEAEQVTMGGLVTLARNGEFVRGNRLELNLKTGVYTMDGAPTSSGTSGARVTSRFNPPARKPQ
jgi:lipopolysaccharide export system protein LptA